MPHELGKAGTYQCPTAPSWGHPSGAEHDAGSGGKVRVGIWKAILLEMPAVCCDPGSLHKWFRIAEEQNGLDPKASYSSADFDLFDRLDVLLPVQSEPRCVRPVGHA